MYRGCLSSEQPYYSTSCATREETDVDDQNVNESLPATGEDLKEWQTPDLIVEEVPAVTEGGTIGDIHPVDDAWYS